MEIILPREARKTDTMEDFHGNKIVVTLGAEDHNFMNQNPPETYYVSFWGKPDKNGNGIFERFKVCGNTALEPVVGTYNSDGVMFRRYSGDSNVPRNLRANFNLVCCTFGGIDRSSNIENIMNKATAEEGEFFGDWLYRNYTEGKINPEIEKLIYQTYMAKNAPNN